MIYIFHGDDIVSSRLALPRGRRYQAKDLFPEQLAQLIDSNELFGDLKPIIIEGIINLPQTKKEVYLWAGKKLSVSQLKKFPGAKIKEFKIAQALWQFIRSNKITDLEKALKTEPIELIWYLFHRQAAKQHNFNLLKKMFTIELNLKSGLNDIPLRTQLELLL